MFNIWSESNFVTNKSLGIAGIFRRFHDLPHSLNRNSLTGVLSEDKKLQSASECSALKRSVDRICDALEVYGLVERTRIRENLKPIKGTERLHSLMISTNMVILRVFATQFLNEKGGKT